MRKRVAERIFPSRPVFLNTELCTAVCCTSNVVVIVGISSRARIPGPAGNKSARTDGGGVAVGSSTSECHTKVEINLLNKKSKCKVFETKLHELGK